ncbi:hypothetical protein J6590_016187 [Homalodisca vitripennis]|nr:hypothetical protein J6590_016187 [Homalodisca vitripennis]
MIYRAAEAAAAAAAAAAPGIRAPPPLLRSRTLPAIVVPGISILQAQIDSRTKEGEITQTGSAQIVG